MNEWMNERKKYLRFFPSQDRIKSIYESFVRLSEDKTLKQFIFYAKGVTGTAKEVQVAVERLAKEIWQVDWYHDSLETSKS